LPVAAKTNKNRLSQAANSPMQALLPKQAKTLDFRSKAAHAGFSLKQLLRQF